MKKYLLLRDNKESGPYTFGELVSRELRPLDLIWIEHASTSWTYASEMEELKGYVKDDPVKTSEIQPRNPGVYVSMPVNRKGDNEAGKVPDTSLIELDPSWEISRPLADFPERKVEENPRKQVWNRKNIPLANLLNVAAVFFGLIAGAVLMKKMVDGSGADLPVQAPVSAQVIQSETMPDKNIRPALVTESIPPEDYTPPVTRKITVPSLKPKDIKKQITVKASEYKVGLFGGISDLKLTLNNASPHQVDRMVVKLDYLKPNGEVVDTKEQQVNTLKPNSSKVIAVPSNKRGVKIRYSITSIYSKEYKLALKQV